MKLLRKFSFLFFLILLLPLFPFMLSLGVMSVWNILQKKDCLLKDIPIALSIPGGLSTPESDWYPMVLTYHADRDFFHYTDDPSLRLTILYNFPAFSAQTGCSRLFDVQSPYYCGFYGAYVVKDTDGGIYGFLPNSCGQYQPVLSQISKLPIFDYQQLVLASFSFPHHAWSLQWETTDFQKDITYAGFHDWFCLDALVRVNGTAHRPKSWSYSYLSYGWPSPSFLKGQREDFADTQLSARIYGKYFPEFDVSIFFYIITKDKQAMEHCDHEILSHSQILEKEGCRKTATE